MEWEATIGLEVHVQLLTRSKLFSGAATAYGASPNSQACSVDLGLPGTLPVLNKEAVMMAIRLGLAIDATVNLHSVFARKNYFYPDLPKGYQISQNEYPIVGHGYLTIDLEEGGSKQISIIRAHLEEDAGKSLHEDFSDATLIDLNRAGVPLIEIVSAPEMSSAKEAVAYLKKLHALVCYLEICDGNLQEGSFRCDANVSVRPKGRTQLGTRTETKNINSFRFVERAINYEIQRQTAVLAAGGTISQQTRLYNPDRDETYVMRDKEDANDYRYFPDPDLLPLELTAGEIEAVRAQLPELPQQKQQRFIQQYDLNLYDANLLTASRAAADYFEQVCHTFKNPKMAANWINGELAAALNKENLNISQSPIQAESLAMLLTRIEDGTISSKIAKEVFAALWEGLGSTDEIIEQKGLRQVTDSAAILAAIDQVIQDNPAQLAEYRAGKDRLLGFFVGQVMKATQGKANPAQLNALLLEKLKEPASHD